MIKLTGELSNRICAEQAIPDMPAIVKELIDNSIDAKCTIIRVTLTNCGIGGIEVYDDGVGIHPNDYQKLCLKGATSKIATIDDLKTIKTMGFRGEALASISKLCKIEIITRHKDLEIGHKLIYGDDGIIEKITEDASRAIGTTVKVTNIFNNVPVRLNDLSNKSKIYLKKIIELVQAYALINIDKRIMLTHIEGSRRDELINSLPAQSVLEQAANLFGRDIKKSMNEFYGEVDNVKYYGYISKPNCAIKFKKDFQYCYFNKRIIGIPIKIKRAIASLYKDFSMKAPIYIICFEAEEGYDCNLTPDKTEVYIQNEEVLAREIRIKILDLCKENIQFLPIKKEIESTQEENVTFNGYKRFKGINEDEVNKKPKLFEVPIGPLRPISKSQAVPAKVIEMPNDIDMQLAASRGQVEPIKIHNEQIDHEIPKEKIQAILKPINSKPKAVTIDWNFSKITWEIPKLKEAPMNIPDIFNEISAKSDISVPSLSSEFHKSTFTKLEILGQFNKGFIMAQLPSTNDLFIIDQHAADEKYQFETLQLSTSIDIQPFVIPKPLKLSPSDEVWLLDYLQILRINGFSLQYNENNEPGSRLTVCAVPISKNIVFDTDDLYEMIEKLKKVCFIQDEDSISRLIRPNKYRAMFASRACRKAVMIGDSLEMRHMKEIVANLSKLEQPWNCPHGRPTLRLLKNLENENYRYNGKKFKNINWMI
ncbi:unnamed protein product [Blepharisma stoltei]|uniref:DNA mismatch repair protein MutL n=1 Tax=Blepharisma stoltei TaxID=1481888 RepID=A0AAU9ILM6_9CILI|nr:unnamed protein product [Blepharisma stoltei]